LRQKSDDESWTFNASSLRFVLRATYDSFAAKAKTEVTQTYQAAATALGEVYETTLGLDIKDFHIEPPQAPKVPPPVGLGKTIAVDLGRNWWDRWWQRRRGLKNHASDYTDLIEAEIGSIIQDLQENQIAEIFDEMHGILADFLSEQGETIVDLVRSASGHRPTAKPAALDGQEVNSPLQFALRSLKSSGNPYAVAAPNSSKSGTAVGGTR
jgi:hypothetical protein